MGGIKITKKKNFFFFLFLSNIIIWTYNNIRDTYLPTYPAEFKGNENGKKLSNMVIIFCDTFPNEFSSFFFWDIFGFFLCGYEIKLERKNFFWKLKMLKKKENFVFVKKCYWKEKRKKM